ncbi:MAG TPA: DUF488 domain-containing protein [Gemmatimonadaceae bacterium]|nr:DUF488 domain-containing protein [Gemmatimonadaceae bacterium]
MDDRAEQEVSPAHRRAASNAATVYTIGHSVRPIDSFLALLARHGIRHVVDVRRYPGSRRHPQFGPAALASSLRDAAIAYSQVPELGGRRAAAPDSPNAGWRNASFRGYADYMSTGEFGAALDRLCSHARAERTAIMCAEALPWRCHRSLIADALVARGHAVFHIMDAELRPHALPSFARLDGDRVTYPGGGKGGAAPDLFAEKGDEDG